MPTPPPLISVVGTKTRGIRRVKFAKLASKISDFRKLQRPPSCFITKSTASRSSAKLHRAAPHSTERTGNLYITSRCLKKVYKVIIKCNLALIVSINNM